VLGTWDVGRGRERKREGDGARTTIDGETSWPGRRPVWESGAYGTDTDEGARENDRTRAWTRARARAWA
jgi:hypothetical protein